MSITIPATHLDLLEQPLVVTLATVMPDGQPHTTAIWRRYDGELIRFTTSRGTQKEKNLRANPQVSLLALDPHNPYRYLEIRGAVEAMSEDGAIEELDRITHFYTGQPSYYGHIVPAEDFGTRTHLICRIRPAKVITRG